MIGTMFVFALLRENSHIYLSTNESYFLLSELVFSIYNIVVFIKLLSPPCGKATVMYTVSTNLVMYCSFWYMLVFWDHDKCYMININLSFVGFLVFSRIDYILCIKALVMENVLLKTFLFSVYSELHDLIPILNIKFIT